MSLMAFFWVRIRNLLLASATAYPLEGCPPDMPPRMLSFMVSCSASICMSRLMSSGLVLQPCFLQSLSMTERSSLSRVLEEYPFRGMVSP